MRKYIFIILLLFSSLWLGSTAFGAIIVGRIAHVEGQVYRYMDADQSWVETFIQSPVGTQDVLATGDKSRAEIAFPNNMLVRLDESAEIDIVNLEEKSGEFFLQTGLARFYNQSAAASMIVGTPRGTAKLGPESTLDIQVAGNTVVVAAVHGETTFQAVENGDLEIISGSSSLEFNENSIIAGVGPINRNWDRWCMERQNVWRQNRVVRSEYLPESMQEYAYVLEPQGNWRRIYYRGYYYWAWQPRYVAVGWAPYTTGYWYDWHGESVWIDHNPWGWATHHHGHWIHTHGAWMWTPYVHVSYVPGVTVVGFNVTFGRTYRPHWHPGRVRWISHSSHIGWLPLAPWETYYGYHRWGPRSVVVRGGVDFSINVNLAHHRYVDHAVIIPKKHFHKRGRTVINNYNEIRIRNINKTVIVNNYKPVPVTEEYRERKHEAKGTRTVRTENRAIRQTGKRAAKKGEAGRASKHTQKETIVTYSQKNGSRERNASRLRQQTAKENSGIVVKRRETAENEKSREKRARTEQTAQVKRTEVRQVETRERKAEKQKNSVSRPLRAREIAKKESRQADVQGRSRAKTWQESNKPAVRRSERIERKQAQKQTHVTQRQGAKNRQESPRVNKETYKETSRKYAEKERLPAARQEKQKDREKTYGPQHNTARNWSGERQGSGRFFASGAPVKRSFR